MKNQILHTPDGVRDIYNGECKKKLVLQDKLLSSLRSFGCQDIETPSFEFFDVFGNQIGTTPSKDLYKFFDKNGNTLVLRPDFTPSIARCAVKYYMDEAFPVRLCYMGNTFSNSSDYQGRFKEVTQCGAELIGDSSVYGDAEILAMMVKTLLASGLKEFQIAVGHSQFFSSIVRAAQVSEESEEALIDYLLNKNFFGVEEVLKNYDLDEDLLFLFSLLGKFDNTAEDLELALQKAEKYAEAKEALLELVNLFKCLDVYGISKYISFELGIISDYKYYTGIIFAGYTYGTGEAIVKGGRYDKLLKQFGKDCPAIGFAIVVDQLMAAISRQKIEIAVKNQNVHIVFKENCFEKAIKRALCLRESGKQVETILWKENVSREAYEAFAQQKNINTIEFLEN